MPRWYVQPIYNEYDSSTLGILNIEQVQTLETAKLFMEQPVKAEEILFEEKINKLMVQAMTDHATQLKMAGKYDECK